MERCKTCRHFQPDQRFDSKAGACGKWLVGYGYGPDEIGEDGCTVEGHEGWGMLVGHMFGCVLHETSTALDVNPERV